MMNNFTRVAKSIAANKTAKTILLSFFAAICLCIAPATVNAQAGAALNYDGTDDQVQITGYKGVSGAAARTVEAWIKTTSASQRPILEYGTPTEGLWFNFNVTSAGRLQLAISNNNISSTNAVNDGNWHHVAVVVNSSSLSAIQFYIDGNLETNSAVAGGGPGVINTSAAGTDVMIGYSPGLNTFFEGTIDEVKIWNINRTQAQIKGYKNCEIPVLTNLQAYYQFNQGTAGSNNAGVTSLTDVSGNGRTGTLQNFALNGATSNWVAPGGVVSGAACSFAVGDYISLKTGTWNTASNWARYGGTTWALASVAPSSGDAAITISSNDSIAITSAVTADQIIVSAGGKLSLNSVFLNLPDGAGTDLNVNGSFYLNSGTVNGLGTTAINAGATFVWNSGTLVSGGSFGGTLTTDAASTVLLNGGSKVLGGLFTFNNGSNNCTLSNGNILFTSTNFFTNTGTINISGDVGFSLNTGTSSVITNAGIINKTSGTGSSSMGGSASITFHNTGTLNALSGTITLPAAGAHTGLFNVSTGSTINFNSGTHSLNAGTSFTGLGAINFAGSTATIASGCDFLNTANVAISSGTVIWNNSDTVGSLAISSTGILQGSGTLSVSNSFTCGAGTIGAVGVSGNLVILAGAVATKSGISATLQGPYSISNYSNTFNFNGGDILVNNNGVFNNYGTVIFNGDNSINRNLGSGGAVNNFGTVIKSGGTGNAFLGGSNLPFNSSGTLTSNSGTIRITSNTSSTFSGAFNAGTGAIISFEGIESFNGAASFNGAGSINLISGTLSVDGSASNTLSIAGNFNVSGGSLQGVGKIDFLSGSTCNFSGAVMVGSGTTTVKAGATFICTGTGLQITTPRIFTNESNSFSLNTASIFINNNAVFNNSGTISITGNGNFNIDQNAGTGGFINNTGIITKVSGTGSSSIGTGGNTTFNNTGTVNVNTGTLSIGSIGNYGGDFNIAPGATMNATSTPFNNANVTVNGILVLNPATFTGGILTNNGSISSSTAFNNSGTYKGSSSFSGGGLFNNLPGGHVAPGNSPGCQTFGSGFTSSGALDIEVNGKTTACTDYDQITVTGTATLSGTLNVTVGYTPADNDSVTIIIATNALVRNFCNS